MDDMTQQLAQTLLFLKMLRSRLEVQARAMHDPEDLREIRGDLKELDKLIGIHLQMIQAAEMIQAADNAMPIPDAVPDVFLKGKNGDAFISALCDVLRAHRVI